MSHNDNMNGLNQQFGKPYLFSYYPHSLTHSLGQRYPYHPCHPNNQPTNQPTTTTTTITTANNGQPSSTSTLLHHLLINENGPSPKRDHFFFCYLLLVPTVSGLSSLYTITVRSAHICILSKHHQPCRMRAGNIV
jgi:hypothetical protein